jgi:hypothetical protein
MARKLLGVWVLFSSTLVLGADSEVSSVSLINCLQEFHQHNTDNWERAKFTKKYLGKRVVWEGIVRDMDIGEALIEERVVPVLYLYIGPVTESHRYDCVQAKFLPGPIAGEDNLKDAKVKVQGRIGMVRPTGIFLDSCSFVEQSK